MTPQRRKRWLWAVVIMGLFFVPAGVGYMGFRLASGANEGARLHTQGNEIGGTFRVFSLGGGMVTEGDFRGSWMVTWFVDPHCPKERCQPPLKALDQSLVALEKQGVKILPLVVSLDVKAEDTDDLKDYVMGVAPHIFPVFTTENMIKAMTALYHAPLQQEGGYFIPAPSFVVMTPDGRYAGMLPITGDGASLTEGLKQLIGSSK